jgi:hypothetical protein
LNGFNKLGGSRSWAPAGKAGVKCTVTVIPLSKKLLNYEITVTVHLIRLANAQLGEASAAIRRSFHCHALSALSP